MTSDLELHSCKDKPIAEAPTLDVVEASVMEAKAADMAAEEAGVIVAGLLEDIIHTASPEEVITPLRPKQGATSLKNGTNYHARRRRP